MNNTSIVRQVVELEYMTSAELRQVYNNLFTDKANSNANKDHLIHKIAYRIQELAYGGLDEQTKSTLEAVAKDKNFIKKLKCSDLIPGTKICKEYKNIMHEVEVKADGFEYNGIKWSSLSAIATKITGTKWNGPKFFNLRD